jgi:DNA-binding response OmpR family regulator
MDHRILIIEDDPEIADLIELHFRDHNFGLDRAADGESGLEKALANDYDAILLDLMLPGLDGVEVCKRIRQHKNVPIIMLTARSEELDRVLGLELGADDYVTKPFSVRELIARVKAILRRVRTASEAADESGTIAVAGIEIDRTKRRVTLGGRPVELTAKEFDLLVLFASHPGRVFSRNELLDKVWGYQFEGYGHTVNSHINRLRAKIEKNSAEPTYITTVWGVGYKFMDVDPGPEPRA